MLTVTDLRELYDFHHWATDRVFDAIASVNAEQLDRPWGGSFGTGRALLRHVVGVERMWCERWNGRSPTAIADFPASSAGSDFRNQWELVKADQRRFIETVTEEKLAASLEYVNTKGIASSYPLHVILRHCVNHGTYHRGQLTHLLRDLAIPVVSTDFLLFADERRKM